MEQFSNIDFNAIKGFICDMDGVIYHGNQILPGVREFIQWMQDENKEYLFLTNNSGYTPRELNQKLARMGLDVPEEHFYTSALATAAFLRQQAPGCSVFAIGEAGAANAALYACQILALGDTELTRRLADFRIAQNAKARAMTLPVDTLE